jgi:hypothetical protein
MDSCILSAISFTESHLVTMHYADGHDDVYYVTDDPMYPAPPSQTMTTAQANTAYMYYSVRYAVGKYGHDWGYVGLGDDIEMTETFILPDAHSNEVAA